VNVVRALSLAGRSGTQRSGALGRADGDQSQAREGARRASMAGIGAHGAN